MAISKSRSHAVYTVTIIGFIFTLHVAIPVYSNSSFLSLFANESAIGLIYMAGAGLSILGYLIAPIIIRKLGNYSTTILLVCLQVIAITGLIFSNSPQIIALLFILQSALSLLIGFCIDIFLESYTSHHSVGTIRGLYTATLNSSWLIGPLLGSIIINGTESFRGTYIVAVTFLFPLLYLIHRNFPNYHDPEYTHPSPWQLIKKISGDSNLTKLFYANLILQIFYSWMVVYSPIYLNRNIGFNWEEIGLILLIMLLPFPLIQYPLGRISDNKFGEIKILALGFLIMGISTIMLSAFTVRDILIWSILLFVTRIGAASVEVMLETYLFKKISDKDSSLLGAFRITRPASFFFSSSIMIFGLLFIDIRYMFVLIGGLCILALFPVLTMKDIK